jgi:osmoprotectant transport system permease protein
MSFIAHVFGWFTTSANWTGAQGIPLLFWHQLTLSVAVVVTAIVLGGGLGVVLGHTGRGGLVAVNAANAFRAVPTLALLTLLAIQPAISLKWNGFLAASLALTALAIPPILTNTYVGMSEVDADVRDAAKAMGLTGGQVLRTVEAPLAVPFVMAGIRTASIEVVATSTLAAYVSYTDLGTYVITGLNTNDSVIAFSGAILVAVMAGLIALVLTVVTRVLTPRPLRPRAGSGSLGGGGLMVGRPLPQRVLDIVDASGQDLSPPG